ncbi:MAG: hypothetical protein DI528_22495 [Shinella sp.]|nr:MAG: hypothetical protein DI528_22495 [Shinella sp.]
MGEKSGLILSAKIEPKADMDVSGEIGRQGVWSIAEPSPSGTPHNGPAASEKLENDPHFLHLFSC